MCLLGISFDGGDGVQVLSYLTERRLRPVCRIANADEQVKRLSEMMGELEVDRDAG